MSIYDLILGRLVILGIFGWFYQDAGFNYYLDYLMLNTDRGADNYMIKYCEGDHEKSLIDVAPQPSKRPQMLIRGELRHSDTSAPSGSTVTFAPTSPPSQALSSTDDFTRHPHIHIAAIDNSLSFPHEHPQGWRSYTYGWLYLPVSLIGRPFSEKTRQHFLPLLTSKTWWEETTFQLRKIFAVDPDFHPKMFKVGVLSPAHADLCRLRIMTRDNWLLSKDKLTISSSL